MVTSQNISGNYGIILHKRNWKEFLPTMSNFFCYPKHTYLFIWPCRALVSYIFYDYSTFLISSLFAKWVFFTLSFLVKVATCSFTELQFVLFKHKRFGLLFRFRKLTFLIFDIMPCHNIVMWYYVSVVDVHVSVCVSFVCMSFCLYCISMQWLVMFHGFQSKFRVLLQSSK